LINNEDDSYQVIELALALAAPDVPAELLVADSSRAHFHQVACTDGAAPACPVASPMDCPAANRGQTQVWNSSTDLDTCPYLRNGPAGACSATCVPVSIAGKTIGVLHATTPDQTPPDRNTIDNLELIARKSGERIGMLRAFARSETQAHTDPLTGLMNRRSLEAKLHDLTEENRQYVVVFGDLDHFKMLNDVHGHDAGDRALRLFARILRDSVRPNDLACRYGGEEFLIVLPECTVQDAQAVLERIREKLVDSLQDGTVPPFTASFGLVSSAPDTTSSETIQTADNALLTAKTTGRNRIVIANTEISDVPELIDTDVADAPPSSEGLAALVEAALAE
jgi:diguanylate cyclase (GGDEF)-like protein